MGNQFFTNFTLRNRLLLRFSFMYSTEMRLLLTCYLITFHIRCLIFLMTRCGSLIQVYNLNIIRRLHIIFIISCVLSIFLHSWEKRQFKYRLINEFVLICILYRYKNCPLTHCTKNKNCKREVIWTAMGRKCAINNFVVPILDLVWLFFSL